MATPSRPHNPDQISTNLPGLQHHITSHDSNGKAIIHSDPSMQWTNLLQNTMSFNVVYTTSTQPPTCQDDQDITQHEEVMKSGQFSLVNPAGSVARIVDFGPSSIGATPIMHRTQSLDYGIVLEGEIELVLDSGEKRLMRRGDVCVQRCTNHAWRNTSETDWARMFFVLIASEKLIVEGKEMGEDVSAAGDAGKGH